jgi:Mg-chelatase subunit ChlD
MTYKTHLLRIGFLFVVLMAVTGGWAWSSQTMTVTAQTQNVSIDIRLEGRAQNGDANDNPVLAPGNDLTDVVVELEGLACPAVQRSQPVDIALVLDVSGSMDDSTPDGESKLEATKTAAINFLSNFNLDPNDPRNSDQVALVAFASSPTVISGLSRDRPALISAINGLSANGGTDIPSAIDAGTNILNGPDGNFAGDAASVIVLLSDGQDNLTFSQRAANRARQTAQARIVTIGLGDDVDRDVLTAIADTPTSDNAFFANNAQSLNSEFSRIARLITPRLSAEDITLNFQVNTSNFELIDNTQRPTNGVINLPAQVSWTRSSLNTGQTATFRFTVRPLQTGSFQVGTATIEYTPCESDVRASDSAVGPPISVLRPTSTPTPTNTPTPTSTPTPTNTPTSTPASPLRTVSADPVPNPGITSLYCGEGFWNYFPWLVVALVALIVLWLIIRAFRNMPNRPGLTDWLCLLMKILTYLALLPLAWFLAQPIVGAICPIPENVYFWRQDGNQMGIFLTHEDLPDGQEPAQVAFVNEQGCVACHSVSRTGQLSAMVAPVPNGDVMVFDLNGDEVPITDVPGMYSALSPDGTQLAFTTADTELFVLDLETSQIRQLQNATDANHGALMPNWSPDSEAIVYVRALRRNIDNGLAVVGTSDLYMIPAQGGTAIAVNGASNNAALNYYPAFSPSGEWIAFTRNDVGDTTYSSPNADVWLTNLTTGTTKAIEANGPASSDSWATWNRDGTRLAFNTTQNDRNFDVVTVDIDPTNGVTAREVVPMPGASEPGTFEHLPSWGEPIARESIWPLLLGAWPWLLLPIGLFVLQNLLCRLFGRRKETSVPPPIRKRKPRKPAVPPKIEAVTIPPVWTPRPALVLGLGDSGWHVLTQLKKTLSDAGSGQVAPTVQLLSIITSSQDKLVTDEFRGLLLDEETELVTWRDNLQDLVQSAEDDPALQEWVDQTYLKRQGDAIFSPNNGLQNQRVLGRAALIQNLRGVSDRTGVSIADYLTNSAKATVEAGKANPDLRELGYDGQDLDVIIITDMSDDVGSAIYADMAYLSRRLKQELGLQGVVRVVGHAVTDVGLTGQRHGNETRQVNTIATLRELKRFQLASDAPYPMIYGTETQPTPYDGVLESMLFDELYVHDGQRDQSPLTTVQPNWGVYPALADMIAIWLDSAAYQGTVDELRNSKRSDTNTAQLRERKLVVSGMGVMQYRLPFADLLDDVTLKYASSVIDNLMRSEEAVRVSDKTTEPTQLAILLLDEEFAANPLSHWHSFLQGYAIVRRPAGDDTNEAMRLMESGARQLRYHDEDKHRWMQWLSRSIETILNGAEDGNDDAIAMRAGKAQVAVDILAALSEQVLPDVRSLAVIHEEAKDPDAIRNALDDFAAVATQLKESLESELKALGIDMQKQSLAFHLARRYREVNARWKDLETTESNKGFVTREYVVKNANGEDLADVWYNKYFAERDQVQKALRQLIWKVQIDEDAGTITPQLRLHFDDTDEVIFQYDEVDDFADSLLKLARLLSADIRDNETLESVLSDHLLDVNNPARINETVDRLRQGSSPLLSVEPTLANRLQRSYILALQSDLDVTPRLQSSLKPTGITNATVELLESTDPYTLTVIQTVDTVTIDGIRSLSNAQEQYQREMGIVGRQYDRDADMRPSVFPAEANALAYERRLVEVNQQGRMLHPAVVTALSKHRYAEAYLLALAAGRFITVSQQNGMMLQLPEGGSVPLLSARQAQNPRYTLLLDGLLNMQKPNDDGTALVQLEDVETLIARHKLNDDLLDALEDWYDAEGLSWNRYRTNDKNRRAVDDDLYILTELLILDIIGEDE